MVSKQLPAGSSKNGESVLIFSRTSDAPKKSFDSQQYEKNGYLVVIPRGNGMTQSKPASSLQKEMLISKQNKTLQSFSGDGIVPDV
jgi:hypothetical protein